VKFLKQSTAKIFRIGPFLDDTDGKTAEPGLTIAQADIQISKNGGAFAQTSAVSPTTTHDADGWYQCPLTTTDTATLGPLTVQIVMAGALPVWEHFHVVTANFYDTLFSTDLFDVNVTHVADTSQTAGDHAAEIAKIPKSDGTASWNATALGAINAEADTALSDYDPPTRAESLADAGITLTGTAAAGSSTTITLTGGVATDNYYNGQVVKIDSGTGAGQARTILSYVGSTTVATVTRDWVVAPSSDSVYSVYAGDWPAILEAGTAQAGAAGSITFDAGASAINDTYKNNSVMITGGTGLGQCRLIGGYTGSTKVATVIPNWTTNPDATSVYQVLPMARVDVAGVSGTLQTAGDLAALITTVDGVVDDILVDTGTTIPGTITTMQGNVTDILADTGELQTDWADGGRLDLLLDACSTHSAADVWDAVSATLSLSFEAIIDRLYQHHFNELNITDASGYAELRNFGDTAELMNCTITDNDTTTVRTAASWT
jgi:hypothetical protein